MLQIRTSIFIMILVGNYIRAFVCGAKTTFNSVINHNMTPNVISFLQTRHNMHMYFTKKTLLIEFTLIVRDTKEH